MTHYCFFVFILLQQGADINSAETILNISAAVGGTAELVCKAEPTHRQEPKQTLSWYQCRNITDCEQLLGSVTPTLKCLSTSLRHLHFKARTSENRSTALVISDLQEDDAGFYKCVMRTEKQILATQQVYLQIKQANPQLTTTAIETTSSKECTSIKLRNSAAEETLTSIAVAVWLGVIAVLLFLCLYGRFFYQKASLQASVRRPDMFQMTQTCNETTAGRFLTDGPLQRVRQDSEPQREEDAYESLSRGTDEIYSNLGTTAIWTQRVGS